MIDTSFDFRSDAGGRDADQYSPTLRKYHQLLWSKPLPARFAARRYTIGGMLVFPSNVVDRKPTINGARGFDQRSADRVDLTLECVRRYYIGQQSPLTATLARYPEFFALFGDFAGYVRFFLLQDLVTQDCSAVKFFLPFDDFRGPAVPSSLGEYRDYRRSAVSFLTSRNRRIARLKP